MTPYVEMRFAILHDVLLELFSVSTLVADFVVVKRAYSRSLICLSHGVSLVYLIELDCSILILYLIWICCTFFMHTLIVEFR